MSKPTASEGRVIVEYRGVMLCERDGQLYISVALKPDATKEDEREALAFVEKLRDKLYPYERT